MRFLGLFGFADINSFQTGCTAFVFAVMVFRMRLRYNTLEFSYTVDTLIVHFPKDCLPLYPVALYQNEARFQGIAYGYM
jgi:hypothetical protein